MIKQILKLRNVQELNKKEQQSIHGAARYCCEYNDEGTKCILWAGNGKYCP